MLPTELLDKPLFQMTGGEFIQLMKQSQPEPETEKQDFTNNEFVAGISGLARFLGCGRTKAAEYRASRILDEATHQLGNKIFFHKEKVMKIMRNHKNQ